MALRSTKMPIITLIPVGDDGTGYTPGVCNIGPWEIRRRRSFAVVAFVAAALLFAALVAADLPTWTRLALLAPLTGGVFSWLQARRRFCAGFAMAGIANFGDAADLQKGVQDDGARKADLAAVRRMARDAVLIALPITLVAVLLPV